MSSVDEYEKTRKLIEGMKKLSDEEKIEILKKAGILTEDGKLADYYKPDTHEKEKK